MKKTLLALAVLAPLTASAAPYRLDHSFSCSLSVREFFAPLVQQRLIQTPAERVTPPAVSVFHPAADNALTFGNMPVTSVWGYTNDPLLFQQADPNAERQPKMDGYGVYLHAPIAEVEAVMQSLGNTTAIVRRVDTDVTAIGCVMPLAQ